MEITVLTNDLSLILTLRNSFSNLEVIQMPGHFGGPRKGRDGTVLPTKTKSSGCPFNTQKLRAIHDEWKVSII